MEKIQFDEKDQKHLDEVVIARASITTPRIGDYVHFPTGEVERISYGMRDQMQTSPTWAGSYFLHSHGDASFSGSLNPPIPKDSLTLTGETESGEFWFFHHQQAGAGRGVRFSVPCRIYATSAIYRGYVTRGFSCEKECAA